MKSAPYIVLALAAIFLANAWAQASSTPLTDGRHVSREREAFMKAQARLEHLKPGPDAVASRGLRKK